VRQSESKRSRINGRCDIKASGQNKEERLLPHLLSVLTNHEPADRDTALTDDKGTARAVEIRVGYSMLRCREGVRSV